MPNLISPLLQTSRVDHSLQLVILSQFIKQCAVKREAIILKVRDESCLIFLLPEEPIGSTVDSTVNITYSHQQKHLVKRAAESWKDARPRDP